MPRNKQIMHTPLRSRNFSLRMPRAATITKNGREYISTRNKVVILLTYKNKTQVDGCLTQALWGGSAPCAYDDFSCEETLPVAFTAQKHSASKWGYGVTDLSQYCIIGIIWPETRRGGRWQKPVLTKEHAIKLQRLLFGIFIVTLGQSRLSYIWFSEAQKGLANAPSDAKNIRNRNLLSLKRSQNKIMGSVRLLSRWPQKQKENNELKQTGLKNAEKSEIIRMVDKNLQQKSWDIRYLLQLSSAKKQKWR